MAELLIRSPKVGPRVEIARSFAYKLNCANYPWGQQYESRDFFASEKAECDLEDATEVSERLYQFCRSEVMRSVREYIAEAGEKLLLKRKGA